MLDPAFTSDLGSGPDRLLFLVGLALMPVAIGIAILRYRLYDIDRLVSRSIAYALVTGGLIAVYALVNLVLTTVFGSLTRADPVAVAASTLVVAALFTPVRRRVRSVVDHRFDRARYDAEQTTMAFAGTAAQRDGPRDRGNRPRRHGSKRHRPQRRGSVAQVRAVPMSSWRGRLIRWLAVVLLLCSYAMIAFIFTSVLVPGNETLPDRPTLANVVSTTLVFVIVPTVGAILAILRPREPDRLAVLLCGMGYTIGVFSKRVTSDERSRARHACRLPTWPTGSGRGPV